MCGLRCTVYGIQRTDGILNFKLEIKDVPMTGDKKQIWPTSSFVSMRRQSFLRAAEAPASISGVAKEYLGWEKLS